jgi:hypothetical protein
LTTLWVLLSQVTSADGSCREAVLRLLAFLAGRGERPCAPGTGSYPAADIAALYRARWHAELDLRSLKATLAMDVLRGKTPPIVRKEIWAHLLAYNLIRAVIARAAVAQGVLPRTLSFKAALQTLHAFGMFLCLCGPSRLHDLYPTMLAVIATQHVAHRPGRFEPRARKRRPKPHPYLTIPRTKYKAALLQTTSA